ncbi:hypothetical protein ACIOWF_16040 [Cellulosimicrobium cellulans]|uniref:hypothetical protein n=1 Tax=Cellulosimicrobium cellulans TaxID=1710 RepID=UPI003815C494
MADAHSTAQARRRIAIDALGSQLSSDPGSAAVRLAAMLDQQRPMFVSADIDGLVSAAMLASVAPGFEIVAFSVQSSQWLVHPSVVSHVPDDMFGVDLFSVRHDNVSNHVVTWGRKQIKIPEVRQAFELWDTEVATAASQRLLAVPAIWANTEGGYESGGVAYSATYKYPLGTAQVLLAMLEAAGRGPKFYDRTYLPWLVANCDGGIDSYTRYANNARVWWPVMAGAVGPGSMTEQIFRMVDTMRPHDFLDAVHRLDRERPPSSDRWLNDKWNLVNGSPKVIKDTLTWLAELTGWRDPVRGGTADLGQWQMLHVQDSAQVYYTSTAPNAAALAANPTWVKAKEDPVRAAGLITGALTALNANFYFGREPGSRFNWVGGWATNRPVVAVPPAGAVAPPTAVVPTADPPQLTLP